jgi:hypothetical protein
MANITFNARPGGCAGCAARRKRRPHPDPAGDQRPGDRCRPEGQGHLRRRRVGHHQRADHRRPEDVGEHHGHRQRHRSTAWRSTPRTCPGRRRPGTPSARWWSVYDPDSGTGTDADLIPVTKADVVVDAGRHHLHAWPSLTSSGPARARSCDDLQPTISTAPTPLTWAPGGWRCLATGRSSPASCRRARRAARSSCVPPGRWRAATTSRRSRSPQRRRHPKVCGAAATATSARATCCATTARAGTCSPSSAAPSSSSAPTRQ